MRFHALAAGWAVDLTLIGFRINGARLCGFLTCTSSLSLLDDPGEICMPDQNAEAGSTKQGTTIFNQAGLQRLIARRTTAIQSDPGW
jgi:hypothetical protein